MDEIQNTPENKKVIFSGVQPSGTLTLGNYIGAIRNWKLLENDYRCIYSVVDLHAITVRQDATQLRKRCVDVLALLLAVGLDPEKTLIYFQSHVPAHAELGWILDCYTYVGELSRMTQFKDKSAKHAENVNAGLMTYPVLMAADILLYHADLVPVGVDQKQHLELARNIAIRFNNLYPDTFTVPDGYIPKTGARVMSLQDPTRKMSKSDPEDTYVAILDEPDVIARKLKRAVTDSEACVRFDPENKPGISNLMAILGALTGQTMEQIEADFVSRGYGDFKSAVADAIIETLTPIREEHKRLVADKPYLEKVMRESAEKANAIAERTLSKVRRRVGLAPFRL